MENCAITRCPCCYGRRFNQVAVLDEALVQQWQLSPEERAYVELQQGLHCSRCKNNLRAMALASVITRRRMPLAAWVLSRPWLRVLEVNTAGALTKFFRVMPRHRLTVFPDVDMMALPFDDGSFDLVIHSDTLEHVPDPVAGLRECRRVLSPRGRLCFSIPIIVGRASLQRPVDQPSYHGSAGGPDLVVTEYGADFWTQIHQAGFTRSAITALTYPAGLAIEALP